jgi:hypothetical protein
MADQKITQLTELTTPTTDDMLAVVDDPAGTPLSKKLSILNLLTLGLSNVTVQVLTSATPTYTPTTAMKKVLFILVGPGGNGGNVTAADDASGGGGGGGVVIKLNTAAQVGGSQSCTVGQSSGNNTAISGLSLTASSGSNGSATGNTTTLGTQAAGGAGGAASGGDLNIPGMPGMRALIYDTTNGCGGSGGNSVFGLGGAQSGTNVAGNNGTAYGGGGGGCHTNADVDRSGGAGAAGVIYAVEFLG